MIAGLTLAAPARAQAVLTLQGAGSDSGISVQFLTNGPLTTPGLTAQFLAVPPDSCCTVPAGESCTGGVGQVAWSTGSGDIRLTTHQGGSLVSRTWSFPAFFHNGVYISVGGGGGFEPAGTVLTVTGIDGTAGEPQSNATGTQFQFPLESTVTNTAPATLSGVTVTFTAAASGPSATLPNGGHATTDSTGRATITPTANGTAGAYQITASATAGGFAVQYAFTVANVNTIANPGSCQVSTSVDDFSSGSLRYVIAACGQGSTITFAGGVSPNVQFEPIPLTQDITIDGGSGVTISGNRSRIFFIQGGTITLKNLTLQNGQATGGAGGDGSQGGGGGAGMGRRDLPEWRHAEH